MLVDCCRKMPVTVELGLQTIHPDTIRYIRRGYPNSVYETAVKNLQNIGVNVVTHVIAGLPGETKENFLDTVRYVADIGSDGIKLQLLHVLKGTDLALDYESKMFRTLTPDEYLDYIAEALSILPPDMVIHRVTGDGPKDLLIAPLWSANKRMVLNSLQKNEAGTYFQEILSRK
ncbi:MAG: radical SAM protein [Clostridium sp.]